MSMVSQCDVCKRIDPFDGTWMYNALVPYMLVKRLKNWDEWEIDIIDDVQYVHVDLCPTCVNALQDIITGEAEERR